MIPSPRTLARERHSNCGLWLRKGESLGNRRQRAILSQRVLSMAASAPESADQTRDNESVRADQCDASAIFCYEVSRLLFARQSDKPRDKIS
jgi:hypothetical protein